MGATSGNRFWPRVTAIAALGLIAVMAPTSASVETGNPSHCALAPSEGLVAQSMMVDGVRRTYELHVPRAVDDGPVPLVLAFHGLGGSGRNHAENANWQHHADARGFVLVAPDGIARSWQFDGDSGDLAFAEQLIATLLDTGCIDDRRVHAAGHSMGGHFSHRIACDLTDRVASIAVYAGGPPDRALLGSPCEPTRPIAVAMFHGDADGTRRIEDGRETRDDWVARNGCEGEPSTTDNPTGDGITMAWRCPAGAAVFWREYEGQQHAWPDEPRATEMSTTMLDFLDRHPLPAPLGAGRGAPTEMQLVRSYHASFQGLQPSGEPAGPRTGTVGGKAVHTWFGRQLSRLGLDITTQTFGVDRFTVRHASLSVGDFTPEVWPLFYSGVTASVTAPMVDVGSGTAAEYLGKDVAGRIVVAHSPLVFHARVVTLEQAVNNAVAGGAAALVMAVDGPGNHYFTPNAPAHSTPGLPVLFTGQHDGERLRMLDGVTAAFVLDATIEPATAYNTYASIAGAGDGTVIIGTPLNGWFDVATERGSGVAVLLEVARRFATSGEQPAHTLVFVGTGGHELEAGGLRTFLACVDPERVVAYVHMGATVGGYAYEEVNDEFINLGVQEPVRSLHLSENPLLQAQAHAAFDPHLGSQVLKPGGGAVNNPGEQADAYALGIPMAAISGANLFFHTRADVPDTLSQAVLAPMSDAYTTLVSSLLATTLDEMRAANTVAAARAEEPAPCSA